MRDERKIKSHRLSIKLQEEITGVRLREVVDTKSDLRSHDDITRCRISHAMKVQWCLQKEICKWVGKDLVNEKRF